MVISVVVPTFNRREIVKRTIESLFAQDFPSTNYEIVVVVDGSRDGTADALRALKAPCRVQIVEQANKGLAGARNTGARAAGGDLLLFLDDDMLCDPGLVAAHAAAHSNSPRTVGFGAIFLSPDSPPSLAAECFKRELGAFYLRHTGDAGGEHKDMEYIFGNSSIPRDLLMEAEGFDESFRMREDLELWVRLAGMGVRPQYVPGAVAFQYYAKTSADLIRDAEAFAVADVMFARRHPQVRDYGQLRLLDQAPDWKRALRMVGAFSPALTDLALTPLCALGEAFFTVQRMRNLGVRALQIRRRAHWLHQALALGMPKVHGGTRHS